MANQDNTV